MLAIDGPSVVGPRIGVGGMACGRRISATKNAFRLQETYLEEEADPERTRPAQDRTGGS